MIRLMMTLVLACGLTGCQSVKYPLPSCDGYSKRPLNKSMWNWDARKGVGKLSFMSPGQNSTAIQAINIISPDNPDSYKSCT